MTDATLRTDRPTKTGSAAKRHVADAAYTERVHQDSANQPPVHHARLYRGPFVHGSDYRLTPLALELLVVLAAQATWWAAVLYGNLAAAIALLLQLSLQLLLQRFVRTINFGTVKLMLMVAGSGLLLDAMTVATGAVSFRDGALFELPPWLLLLWLSFAFALPGWWQWLSNRRQQILSLAIAGPLAYVAGAQWGAISIIRPELYAGLLLGGWVLLPWFWCGYQRRLQAMRETTHDANQR